MAEWSRRLVAEQALRCEDLIWPIFVAEPVDCGPVAAMPEVSRLSIEDAVHAASAAYAAGIAAIALFPCTPATLKSADGTEALNDANLVCRVVRAIKAAVPGIGIICDVALDPYTSHGHDGLLNAQGHVDNDDTVAMLCQQAVLMAQAGADVVAPSDMMDGRIGAIRAALDAQGHEAVMILSYAAKYASAFYGPFRDAVGSSASLGKAGKHSYQMHPANGAEALREAAMDIAEGADWLMVKPAMPYLDVVRDVSQATAVPVFAYQVSGEYAALRFAAQAGALDYRAAMLESLLCLKRAGARAIFTYAAMDVALWLKP